jgi:two-component system KDP operon response regulator KdpE
MKILVASNDINLTEYIHNTLNICQQDWELSITDSNKRCLEIVKNGNCPDIILLDIKIGDILCLKLIETIRDYSDVPIVVLSNKKNLDELVQVFNAGANDYIAETLNKPVFVARLKAINRRREWDMQALEKDKSLTPK